MDDLNKLSCVTERDIDLLLFEEINIDQEFSRWLLQNTMPDMDCEVVCKGAWHSVTHRQLGESDLIAIYDNGEALLIENKIDAPAQPEQASRYQERGAIGHKDGYWDAFKTLMIAPEKYLKTNTEANHYDARISYEQIRDWFKAVGSPRADFRVFIFNEAIEQNRRGYSPIKDEQATDFFVSYWLVANRGYAELNMPRPSVKPSGSDWAIFKPTHIGKQFIIKHKMSKGCVDLEIKSTPETLSQLQIVNEDPTLRVARTGKSAAIRIEVQPVDRYQSFESQHQQVTTALAAASRLLTIANRIRDMIE